MRAGLIGGLGTAAGIFYYRRLVTKLGERGVPADLLLAHADVRTVFAHQQADDLDGLSAYLGGIIEALAHAGCELAAICAVSPYSCIVPLRARSPVPIVDALKAVQTGLEQSGLRRIALFGTRRVVESDLFGALRATDVARPQAAEVDAIDRLYAALVARGGATAQEREELNRLGAGLVERDKLDAIVFAGTDLSAVFEGQRFDFPVFDAAEAHIEAIVEAMKWKPQQSARTAT